MHVEAGGHGLVDLLQETQELLMAMRGMTATDDDGDAGFEPGEALVWDVG
jgi:hypothetical protein